jgi:hypothetical protein
MDFGSRSDKEDGCNDRCQSPIDLTGDSTDDEGIVAVDGADEAATEAMKGDGEEVLEALIR